MSDLVLSDQDYANASRILQLPGGTTAGHPVTFEQMAAPGLLGAAPSNFSNLLVNIDVNGRRTYNGATLATMQFSPGTLVANVRVQLLIPAGTVTGKIIPAEAWNVTLPPNYLHDSTLDTFIEITTISIGGIVVCYGALLQKKPVGLPTGALVHLSSARQIQEGMPLATRLTDFSGSNNHFAQQGGVAFLGGAFDLSAAANTGATSSLAWPSSAYTICMRVARKSATGWLGGNGNTFAGNAQGTVVPALIYHDNTAGITFAQGSTFPALGAGVGGMSSWVDNDPHFCVFDYDTTADQVRAFFDDMATTIGSPQTANNDPGTGTVTMGVFGSSQSWRQFIYEFIVYNRRLTPLERAAAKANA